MLRVTGGWVTHEQELLLKNRPQICFCSTPLVSLKGDCIRCSMSCQRSPHWIRGARSGRFSPRLLGRMQRPASDGQLGSGFKLHWFKWIVREKAGRLHHCHMDVTRHWRTMGSMPVWICHCDQKHKRKPAARLGPQRQTAEPVNDLHSRVSSISKNMGKSPGQRSFADDTNLLVLFIQIHSNCECLLLQQGSCWSEQVHKHEQSSQTTAEMAADPILLFCLKIN